jgi:hypothetical protein
MNFVANTDAPIIDLRENGGGSPDMVAYTWLPELGDGAKLGRVPDVVYAS